MIYNQDITLDLNTSTSYLVVGATQGDNKSRTLTATILKNGELFTIPDGTLASYRIRKPNGQATWNNAEIYTSESKVVITLNATDLSTSGRCFADVLLTNGSTQLGTVTFIIDVQAAPAIAQGVIESEAFGYLYSIIDAANNTIESAQAWAEGKRGTEDVLGDSYITKSSNNLSVSLDFETFKNNITSPSIGKLTTYNFLYTNNNWEYNNDTVNMLGLGFDIVGTPISGNYIEVTASFADPTWHNNAKWYTNSLKEAEENLKDAENILKNVSATAVANTLSAGSNATAEVQTINSDSGKSFQFTFGLPTGPAGPTGAKGKKGDKGDTGERGLTGTTGATGAQGSEGIGITNITLNSDYTLTFTLSDGSTKTTSSVRGPAGAVSSGATSFAIGDVTTGAAFDVSIRIENNVCYFDFIFPSDLGNIIDDNSVLNNKTWSAEKLNNYTQKKLKFSNDNGNLTIILA